MSRVMVVNSSRYFFAPKKSYLQITVLLISRPEISNIVNWKGCKSRKNTRRTSTGQRWMQKAAMSQEERTSAHEAVR